LCFPSRGLLRVEGLGCMLRAVLVAKLVLRSLLPRPLHLLLLSRVLVLLLLA
jgi:hypothetical protein